MKITIKKINCSPIQKFLYVCKIVQSISTSGFSLDSNILMSLAVLGVAVQIFKGFLWPHHHIIQPSHSIVNSSFLASPSIDDLDFDCIWGKLKRYNRWNLNILWSDLGVRCLFCYAYTYYTWRIYLQVCLLIMVCYQLLFCSQWMAALVCDNNCWFFLGLNF